MLPAKAVSRALWPAKVATPANAEACAPKNWPWVAPWVRSLARALPAKLPLPAMSALIPRLWVMPASIGVRLSLPVSWLVPPKLALNVPANVLLSGLPLS